MRRTLSVSLAAMLALVAIVSIPPVHRLHAQGYSTTSYQLLPTCAFTPTTTAAAAGFPKPEFIGAGQTSVVSYKTNTTAGSFEATCTFPVPITSAALHATSMDLNYNISGVTATSIATFTLNSLTIPATAGGAATGTVGATAGGTLTFSPSTVAVTAVTSGLVYRQNIAFGTPIALNSNIVSYVLDFVVTTPGTTAVDLQLYPGTLYVK